MFIKSCTSCSITRSHNMQTVQIIISNNQAAVLRDALFAQLIDADQFMPVRDASAIWEITLEDLDTLIMAYEEHMESGCADETEANFDLLIMLRNLDCSDVNDLTE